MPIEYRHLTKNELDTFIEMRISQLREEGAKEDIDLRPALKAYYIRHLADGTFEPHCKRSKRLWLRNSSDNGIRYGRKTVH